VDPKDYFQGIWDTNVIHGELVGVPWYVDTRLIYYRKDLLAKAGYDHPPRTGTSGEQMAAIKRCRARTLRGADADQRVRAAAVAGAAAARSAAARR
jgi:ABC-type glycerol-3-phosphate transport system substrate-binding protein